MPAEEIQSVKNKKKGKILLRLLILAVIIGLIFFFLIRVKHINAGFVGIKATIDNPLNNTGTYDLTVVRGYVFYMPLFSELRVYPTTTQTVVYGNINIRSGDGIPFVLKPRVSYRLDEGKAASFFKNHQESPEKISEGYLKEIMVNAYVVSASGFDSDSLARNRAAFEEKANILLAAKMSEAGLILDNANSNPEIPESVSRFNELRNNVRQNTILAAEQLREAYAKANIERVRDSLLNSALTHLVIQKMFIDKWDGKLSLDAIVPKPYKDIMNALADKENVHEIDKPEQK